MQEKVGLLPQMRELDSRAEHVETPCGDGTMKWRIWGDGEPVLLLHGAHGSWLHWQHNIPELSRHYRLLVADMPGFGDSDVVEPLESPEVHARVLEDGLRRILPPGQQVALVGFSAGALIGSHLAVAAPDLVRRLVIVGAGGLGTPMHHATMVSMRGLDAAGRWEANRTNLSPFMFHDASRVDDAAIVMTALGAPRMRSRIAYHVVPDKLTPVLERVRAPIDLVWGEFDWPHPDPELNAGVVRAFQPEAELRVVAQSGHWAMGEWPERFNAALLSLLQTPPRPPRA